MSEPNQLPEIRQNLRFAGQWIEKGRTDLPFNVNRKTVRFIEQAKQSVQEAKKLIDEAIADLDGLIQDTRTEGGR